MLTDEAKLIDVKAAAKRCGIAPRTLLRLADSGRAPWGLKIGGLRRWNVAELDAWIANGCPRIRSIRKGGVK
jgi:predicted DNA-binding transcriptional regulator AlpA